MEITKGAVRGSPYVGVFCAVSEDVAIFPENAGERELRDAGKQLGVEIIRTSIMNSSLLGVFVAVLGRKIAVPELANSREVKFLESSGMEVEMVDATALGNLIAVNENGGIASELLGREIKGQLEKFFGVDFVQQRIAGTDIVGAAIRATNRGFIAHPNISNAEFRLLKKIFGVGGKTTTANYGDPFVGNDVVANSRCAIAGDYTSGHEIIRIYEGLGGD